MSLVMNLFACPLCKQSLIPYDNELRVVGLICGQGHRFDRAKEGYFNLLPVQFKQSKNPGDAPEQLQARRQFLRAGYYDALLQGLTDFIPPVSAMLDLGAGEGFFTHHFAHALPDSKVYGIDIAKQGMKMAAKQALPNNYFAVASSFELPVQTASMELVSRIYAPSKIEEVSRVLVSGGYFLLVAPGQDHLIGLRKAIYEKLRPHQENFQFDGFELIKQDHIKGSLLVESPEEMNALLNMTPFAWRLTTQKRAELLLQPFKDSFDFSLNLLRKI